MDHDTKRPTQTSACAQLCQMSTVIPHRPRTLSFIFASPRSDVLESVASELAIRNINSPIRLRDVSLPGLMSDLARMSALDMRSVVILDAEPGLAEQLRYRAHALGLETPIVILLGEDHGECRQTISMPFSFDKFSALVSRVGGAWVVA